MSQNSAIESKRRAIVTVLLVDEPEWPMHKINTYMSTSQREHWQRWRGKPIRIITPGEMPSAQWNCGTDLVWL